MKSSILDLKSQVVDFLHQLPKQQTGINAIFLFGSFLKSENYRDVDAILVFDDSEAVRVTRTIARTFKKQFAIDLHVQLFLSHDKDNLEGFLSKAGIWERIYG